MSDTPTSDDRQHPPSLSNKQTLNVVTDLFVGPNLRLSDNLFQGFAGFLFAVVGCVVGFVFVPERIPGLIVGGLLGLIVGVFLSGFVLMVYRGFRHLRGKHD